MIADMPDRRTTNVIKGRQSQSDFSGLSDSVKPKIPCSPGFLPVIKEVQATDETAGRDVVIRMNVPCLAMSAKFGISPASKKCSSNENGTPSKPTNGYFFANHGLQFSLFGPESEFSGACSRLESAKAGAFFDPFLKI